MNSRYRKILAWAGIPILFILHADWWLWDDSRLVLGLPVGLVYHTFYCILATLEMMLLVRWAWPAHLEIDQGGNDNP